MIVLLKKPAWLLTSTTKAASQLKIQEFRLPGGCAWDLTQASQNPALAAKCCRVLLRGWLLNA